ncbi:MAG: IS4 family transposase [Pseudomonadota bacterium]|nr:IS4 family transposase [Pseudomonadota bacterium]
MSALVEELADIELGDARLNRRARRVLQRLGEKPTVSIPSACGGWSETRAAYRLFDHAKVTAEKVLAPHTARTVERLREHPRVLCLQDTTEADYTGKTDIQGTGPLNYETRRGLYLHPTLAVTPDRLCLGLLDVYSWAREPGSLGQHKDPARPLEEKESARWVDSYQRVNELAEQLTDTRLTYVADRKADIYDLFVEAPCPESAADWLVRGQHDRALADSNTLRQCLAETLVLAEMGFDQPGGNGRTARTVHQQLKTGRVTLKAPYRRDRVLPDVEVTAILATEPHPPAGEEPVEWLLLTNLPVDTPEQAIEKLQWYLCRWQIGVSGKGHLIQSVQVRPRPRDSSLVAWEAPWRESKTEKPSDHVLKLEYSNVPGCNVQ